MRPTDVEAIVRASREHELVFSYQKDCYALSLLDHVIGGGRPISSLRQGPFARLLDKSIVKRAMAHAASGVLTPECLRRALPAEREQFTLTLTHWGRGNAEETEPSYYYQTSRPGQSLVLQLNFPVAHDRAYRQLVRPFEEHPFVSQYHPARNSEPFTLAWARLDFDHGASEVLIEEVQCDWVKMAEPYAIGARRWLLDGEPASLHFDPDVGCTADAMLRYVEGVLQPYARLWQECVLMAAIEFSYAKLGVRRVYFHTYEGGTVMKRIRGAYLPPRSLYTDLPARFCFTRTERAPRFLSGDRRVESGQVGWQVLELV
jgi:hypothetical protein